MAKIEIHSNDLSGCNGYAIWDSEDSRIIKAMAFEDELMDTLTEKQFKRFEDGEYQFTVSEQEDL
jgi:hypothetical protein